MSRISDQIQCVEDNLNEYGVCNITLEEFIFLKDELYSSGCISGIEVGKKEMLSELKMLFKLAMSEHTNRTMNEIEVISIFRNIEKQLREDNE